MIREHFEYRETITTILADDADHITAAKEGMMTARSQLEEYLQADPFFGTSYSPVPANIDAPEIVRRMADAAANANVGPMAAVAASIAWAGVDAMQQAGAAFGLIDNGGDIALISDRDIRVGLYAGSAPVSGKYAFRVPPQNSILGICTSSATVGPSVSFGIADAVVVFSKNPARADAWATGICNVLCPENEPFAALPLSASEVCGVYAVIGDWTASWGPVPDLIPARVSQDLITRGL